jgi:hypothetical protein
VKISCFEIGGCAGTIYMVIKIVPAHPPDLKDRILIISKIISLNMELFVSVFISFCASRKLPVN